MKKINSRKIGSISGGGLCSGNGGAFREGFCFIGSFLNPWVAGGCIVVGAYCAIR